MFARPAGAAFTEGAALAVVISERSKVFAISIAGGTVLT
jgi:hypothetical protein